MDLETVIIIIAGLALFVTSYAVYLAWSTQKVLEKSHGVLEKSNKVLKGTQKVLKGTQKVLVETHTLIDDWAFISILSDLIKSDKPQQQILYVMIELREFTKSGPHSVEEMQQWMIEMNQKYDLGLDYNNVKQQLDDGDPLPAGDIPGPGDGLTPR